MKNENAVLLNGSAEEVKSIRCPECSGGVTLNYYQKDEKSSISQFCPKCFNSVNLDGIFDTPEWARSLGHHVET